MLGHEPMGIVEEVGSAVTNLAVGDRVVIPFVIACGHCYMCRARPARRQCETTQNREQRQRSRPLRLHRALRRGSRRPGRVPARAARATSTRRRSDTELPDDRYLFLSDILPTAWQGVQYAEVPEGGTLARRSGSARSASSPPASARHLGYRVIAVDPVPERRAMAERYGVETLDLDDDLVGRSSRTLTDGRGPHSVVDAVGMEAHGNPGTALAQAAAGVLPTAVAKPLMKNAGVDRLAALHTAIDAVQRGGTVSLSGVYGGAADPMPMMTMFDKQITHAHGPVQRAPLDRRTLPIVEDPSDPLGVDDLATHRVSLEEAPRCTSCSRRRRTAASRWCSSPDRRCSVPGGPRD